MHNLVACVLSLSFTINVSKMASYLKVALAEKTAVLFTKDGDQHNNLHDMQCMWFVFILCLVCQISTIIVLNLNFIEHLFFLL